MSLLTKEQLEQRLAALHQASLELIRDLSRNAVLERIIQLAQEQSGARYAALGMVNDQGELEKFIPIGMSEEEIAEMPHYPKGFGLIGALGKTRESLRISEIIDDHRSVGFPDNHPSMHTFLGVPIFLGDKHLGQIYLTNKKNSEEFTEDDELVIETLAAYAAVAIQNARLFADIVERDQNVAQKNQDLSLLNDFARVLTKSFDIDEILEHTLSRVVDYLSVEAGEIFIIEEGSKELRLALHIGESPEAFWTRERFLVGECIVGKVAQSGKILVNNSLTTDTSFLRKSLVEAGFQSIACIPLTERGDTVGVMSLACKCEREYEDRELVLLRAIGAWAGTAIQNARFQRQIKRLAVLEERERIGMDLHDGIIQSVYGVGLALEYANVTMDDDPDLARKKIEQGIEGLNTTIREIRSYILDLRPRQLRGEETLKQGLQTLIDEFISLTLSKATLTSNEDGIADLPSEHSRAIFHICQESLANVAKHANAKNTKVCLTSSEDRVFIQISDDGRGFDVRKMSVTLGHGLSNMHRRAKKVGGNVEISSNADKGTMISAWVPRKLSETPDI